MKQSISGNGRDLETNLVTEQLQLDQSRIQQ